MPPSEHDGGPATDGTLLLAWRAGGRRCVVVGAGTVGTRRAVELLAAGAEVRVVAPSATEELEALAASGRLALERRPATADDVAGAALVVVATDDPVTNDHLGAAASAAGALVNRADRSAAGDVAVVPVVRRGPLQVGVSSGGAAPSVSAFVRDRLEEGLDDLLGLDGDELAELVRLVGEVRRSLREEGRRPAPTDWRSAQAASILDLIRSGRSAEAKERLQAWQSS